MKTILVVEDDRIYARTTANWLVKNGMDARYVLSVNSAKEFLSGHEVDLVLSDFRLGDCNGVELLEWMRVHGYRMPFLIMTGYGDIPGAVEAVKKGADNYLPKPVQTEKVLDVIRELLERREKRRNPEQTFYVCKSPLAVKLQEMVRLVAPADSLSVLIRGASGTGKEWVARRIHALGGRSDAPFVAIVGHYHGSWPHRNCLDIKKVLLREQLKIKPACLLPPIMGHCSWMKLVI